MTIEEAKARLKADLAARKAITAKKARHERPSRSTVREKFRPIRDHILNAAWAIVPLHLRCVEHPCPTCGGQTRRCYGKSSLLPFWGCVKFPSCTGAAFPLNTCNTTNKNYKRTSKGHVRLIG